MHSDPIADMATRIRNAITAGKTYVVVPHSKYKEAILEVLKAKTYIHDFETIKEGKFEEIKIHFNKTRPTLNIKRISTPGGKVYKKYTEIRKVREGLGISVVSTSQGIMAGFEAYQKKIGGEILLEVY